MRTPEQIRNELKDCKAKVVADQTGIKYGTLLKFLKGHDIYYNSVASLNEYLDKRHNPVVD